MRHFGAFLLCLTIGMTSCKKSQSTFELAPGTYTGTFQRDPTTDKNISKVTLTFAENTWIGESEFAKYPALCNGTYKITGAGKINFANACFWTAEFDWSLILSGDYTIDKVGNQIVISKKYDNGVGDVYTLTKQ